MLGPGGDEQAAKEIESIPFEIRAITHKDKSTCGEERLQGQMRRLGLASDGMFHRVTGCKFI